MSLQKGHLRFDLPCPHCGKGKEGKHNWCYQTFPLENGNILSVCKRDAEPAQGWKQVKNGQTHDSEGYPYYLLVTQENTMNSQFITPVKDSRLNGQQEKWTEYQYYDQEGKKFVVVKRRDYIEDEKEKKDCYAYHYENGKLVKGLGDIKDEQIPLFGYHTIINLDKNTPIFIGEGEEVVKALRSVGLFAVTNLGGSKRWTQAHSNSLKQFTNLIVCPDMDVPGQEFGFKIAKSLQVKWSYSYDELAKTHGLDYADYITEQRKSGKSDQEIKQLILSKIEDNPREWPQIKPSTKGIGFQKSMTREEVWDKMQWIVENIRGERKLDIEFHKLIGHGGCNTLNDVKYLFYRVLEQIEDESLRMEALDYHKDIIFFKGRRLDLDFIFGKKIGSSIRRKLDNMGVKKYERSIGYFFGVLSSVFGGNLRMHGKRNADWFEPPRIYYADVASASAAKTPLLKSTTRWVDEKQDQESDRYEEAKQRLQELKDQWDEADSDFKQDNKDNPDVNPKLFEREHCHELHFIFNNATIEGMIQKLAQRKRYSGGILIKDELAGFFNAQGQYKQGKGDDKETILELWNPNINLRWIYKTQDTLRIKQQRLSICGGIQKGLLKEYLNTTTNIDGMVSRFLFCITDESDSKTTWVDRKEDLVLFKDVLDKAQEIVDQVDSPIDCHFNDGAYREFVRYWHYLMTLSRHESITNHVLSSYAKKLPTYLLVFSSLIQFIKYSQGEVNQFQIVDEDSLYKAWLIVEFYLGQFLIIQTREFQSKTPIGDLQDILAYFAMNGEITSREICRKFNKKIGGRKMDAQYAHEILDTFIEWGYGKELEGRGRKLQYIAPSEASVSETVTSLEGSQSKLLKQIHDISNADQDFYENLEVTPLAHKNITMVLEKIEIQDAAVKKESEPLPDIEQESMTQFETTETTEVKPSDYTMGDSYILNVQYNDPDAPPINSEVILSATQNPFKDPNNNEWVAEVIYQGKRLYAYLKHLSGISPTPQNG